MLAPQAVNPMQGGAGMAPNAGGPPPPMGQPAGQGGPPPPPTGPGSQPGMPQSPASGINPEQLLARAQAALKAGQITQEQYQMLLKKLEPLLTGQQGIPPSAAPGGASGAPAGAQPAIQQPSQAWGR